MELRWIIVGTLAVVVVLQLLHRVAGAAAGVVWTLGMLAYGLWALGEGQHIAFLGIPVQRWTFATFMVAMLGYNVWVLVRALRTRPCRPSPAS